jgi:hypothetical protein
VLAAGSPLQPPRRQRPHPVRSHLEFQGAQALGSPHQRLTNYFSVQVAWLALAVGRSGVKNRPGRLRQDDN